jgi:hypothetical protein
MPSAKDVVAAFRRVSNGRERTVMYPSREDVVLAITWLILEMIERLK